MKVIDNINYELVIKEYEELITKTKSRINKFEQTIAIKSIIFGIFALIAIFLFYTILSNKATTDNVNQWLFIGCIVGSCDVLLLFSLIYDFSEAIFLVKKNNERTLLLEKKEDIKEKAKEITKNYHFNSIYDLNYMFEQTNFLFNSKIINAYIEKKDRLQLKYVEENEVKEKTISVHLHMFENLEEPTLELTNKGINLNIKYEEFKNPDIIDITKLINN